MSKESIFKKPVSWVKRALWQREKLNAESPKRLLVKDFFRKKSAVISLAVLIALFLFAFIAPAFFPMDANYTDPLQQNIAPVYSLRRVPKRLKGAIADINGFSSFSVGVNRSGEPFVWGESKDRLNKRDLKDIPSQVTAEKTAFISAGKDHILAITKAGNLIGWGDNSCGQYGYTPTLNAVVTPEIFKTGIAPDSVKKLVCGYQVSGLLGFDGNAYLWGNKNAVRNLEELSYLSGVEDIAFTNSSAVALLKDGSIFTGVENPFVSAVSSKTGKQPSFERYMRGKRGVKITATNKCIAVLLESGELVVSGVFENGEEHIPTLLDGEYFTQIDGGTRHFLALTNLGNAYAWGHNAYGQCDLKKDGKTSAVFAGATQSYAVDGDGKLTQAVGLKGYLMGTDGRGRDLFTRIIHGGKMTLTIGAVAVLVSSVIAVVVGCIAGYFGGKTDLILMRITEIFSSIPFLPFAMLLSQIIKNYALPETARIFIIMLILGILSWPSLARMIRGQVLAERKKEYVLSARAIGVPERKIAFKHVLPNILSVVLVSMTLDFAGCLLTESSLSYLGFGVQQPRPTWGNMLTGANNSVVIQNYYWQWLFPALFLSIATICINILGDNLRDLTDPKSRKK
jgi:peptide/nickel transport system permease protein